MYICGLLRIVYLYFPTWTVCNHNRIVSRREREREKTTSIQFQFQTNPYQRDTLYMFAHFRLIGNSYHLAVGVSSSVFFLLSRRRARKKFKTHEYLNDIVTYYIRTRFGEANVAWTIVIINHIIVIVVRFYLFFLRLLRLLLNRDILAIHIPTIK